MIISGLPEDSIIDPDNGETLNDDKDKITYLLGELALTDSTFIQNITVNRIGVEKPGANRLVKLILPSSVIRNNILSKAPKIKNLNPSWSKVYIKKDLHIVYSRENARISKKLADLRNNPDNHGKEIKIVKGKLLVNGEIIDQNTFFR